MSVCVRSSASGSTPAIAPSPSYGLNLDGLCRKYSTSSGKSIMADVSDRPYRNPSMPSSPSMIRTYCVRSGHSATGSPSSPSPIRW